MTADGPWRPRLSGCSTASTRRSCRRAAARSASARWLKRGLATSGPPHRWTAFARAPHYGDRARLTQLLKLLDEGAAIGALAISAERIHLFEWKLGALELIHDWEAEMYTLDWRERKAEKPSNLARTQGAASSGRDQYDQRLEHNRARFLEETGRLTAQEARSRSWRRVIGFGDPRTPPGVQRREPRRAPRSSWRRTVDVISEERGKLLERVTPPVADGNAPPGAGPDREGSGGRAAATVATGALGLIDVQHCLNEGRVVAPALRRRHRGPGLAETRGRDRGTARSARAPR